MEKQIKVVAYKGISSKSGKAYYCCALDLGYDRVNISYDTAKVAEIMGVSVPELIENLEKEVKA